MNDVRDYKVLRPIDIEGIYADAEEFQQEPTGSAYGNSYRQSRKNQDELDRDACWGRAQVFMSKPKSDSIVMQRYNQLKQIPIEKLLGDEEIEVENADVFKEPIAASNPIKPQPFTLTPHKLNSYDTNLTLNDETTEEDYTPSGENFFASTDSSFDDESNIEEFSLPQKIIKKQPSQYQTGQAFQA